MTKFDAVLETLRALWPCSAAEIQHDLVARNRNGLLEEEEAAAINEVGSILHHWERQGRAKEIDKKWHWLPEKAKPREVQRGLFL